MRKFLVLGGLGLGLFASAFPTNLYIDDYEPFRFEDVNPNSKTYHSLLSPQDHREGLLLLNFAAPWCGYCREEFPEFQRLYEQGKIDLLVVNVGDAPWERMKGFSDYTYPFLTGPEEESYRISDLYGAFGVPTTYLIEGSEVKFIKKGAFSKEELEKLVE